MDMKRFVVLILLWQAALSAAGQTYTLEQCIDSAVNRNLLVQQARIQERRDDIYQNSAKMNMLPDLTGTGLLNYLREQGPLPPVLMLSALGSSSDKVEGLNAGADDYLAKPFETGEVTARLHALIRRRAGRADPVLRRGDIELRPAEGVVKVDGQTLQLTGQELRIEPEIATDKAAAARLGVRLINELVTLGGRLTESERMTGPDGERLTIAPSENGRYVRVWPRAG